MTALFDYEKPELLDFNSDCAKGDSCFVDCTTDNICATPADTL